MNNELIIVGGVDVDYERKFYGKENKRYAEIAWRAEDILSEADSMGIDLSIEEAESILEDKEDVIQEAMLGAGWMAINIILSDMSYKDEEDE